jgi:hypothetical protein
MAQDNDRAHAKNMNPVYNDHCTVGEEQDSKASTCTQEEW